jgi:hypothetical protein
MVCQLLLTAVDPSNIGTDGGGSQRSLLDDLAHHQMFLLVALLVLAHIIILAVVFNCLWSQTPKRTPMNQRFFDEQRAEIKQMLAKHE